MFCQRCGWIPGEAKFCNGCGEAQQVVTAPSPRKSAKKDSCESLFGEKLHSYQARTNQQRIMFWCIIAIFALSVSRAAFYFGVAGDDDGATSVPDKDLPDRSWTIDPGKRVGPLTAAGSVDDLNRAYGPEHVRAKSIELGEGETAAGTVVFADDPLRRCEVIWSDAIEKRRPSRVIFRGERSRWRLPHKVTLGTSLRELERLNGRGFTLAGFGWDYGGIITDWSHGALERSLGRGVKLYLAPNPDSRDRPEYAEVLGDRDYSSALPAMQQLNPIIYQIFVDFE